MTSHISLISKIVTGKSEHFHKALCLEAPWTDAVSEQRRDDSNQPDTDTKSRQAFIYRRLGHLTVNPNQPGANEAIISAYVWSDDKRPGIVNSSEDAARDLIIRLINAAQNENRYHKNYIALPDRTAADHQATRMFVLHSERGTGKTFFLNYLLSKFWNILDDEKVVWVRLNLVTNFGPENNLPNWIAAQATKVLIRYYDKNQKSRKPGSKPPIEIDFIEHLKSFVRDKYSDDQKRQDKLADTVVEMMRVFRDQEYEKLFSEDLVPSVLGNEVMRYAREMGYSIIVVLDGLDRLDVTRAAKDKFDWLCRQVDQIGKAYESLGYALLVVSRTKTLNSTHCIFSDPYRQNNQRCMRTGTADLTEIVSRRINIIQSEVASHAAKLQWDLNDWPTHILEFEQRLTQKGESNSYLAGLSQYLGEERRAQMQMVQYDYMDYLESKHSRAYVLIEYLTKAGKRYPPCYYSYQKDNDENWIHAGNAEPTPFDSKFFPTIFSFPRLYDGTIDNPTHPHLIIAGLRIAQVLKGFAELLAEVDNPQVHDHIVAYELAAICQKMFDYPKSIIYLMLEEFAEFGLVDLNGGNFPLPNNPDQYKIVVTPKLRYLIETIIYDIAYLNLAAMRTPVARDVVSREKHTHTYFRAESLDGKRQSIGKDGFISDWIFTKVVNSVGLLRVVRYINTAQKSVYREKLPSLEGRERIIFDKALRGIGQEKIGIFDVAKEMENRIIAQIDSALMRYVQDRGTTALVSLAKRIASHFTKWDGVTYSISS